MNAMTLACLQAPLGALTTLSATGTAMATGPPISRCDKNRSSTNSKITKTFVLE
jgi:hypothetical protein